MTSPDLFAIIHTVGGLKIETIKELKIDGREYKIVKIPANRIKTKEFLAIMPVNAVGTVAIRLAIEAARNTEAVFSIETFDEPFDGSNRHEVFIWKGEPDRAICELAKIVEIYNKAMNNLLNTAFNKA